MTNDDELKEMTEAERMLYEKLLKSAEEEGKELAASLKASHREYHECPEMGDYFENEVDIWRTVMPSGEKKKWRMRVEEYGDRAFILFCPFCGSKLPD